MTTSGCARSAGCVRCRGRATLRYASSPSRRCSTSGGCCVGGCATQPSSPPQARAGPGTTSSARRTRSPPGCWRWVSSAATAWVSGLEWRRAAGRAVRHGPHWRDPRQHQPRVPRIGTGIRAEPGSVPGAGDGSRPKSSDYVAISRLAPEIDRTPGDGRLRCERLPRLRHAALIGDGPLPAGVTSFRALRHLAGRRRRRGWAWLVGGVDPDDAYQHPVHQWDDWLAEGRDAEPLQCGQQRALCGAGDAARRARPAVHPGPAEPSFRDGAWRARLRRLGRGDGFPGSWLRC